METINPNQPLPETTNQPLDSTVNKPPTLVGMIANLLHHLTLRETASLIRHHPLAGIAFIFVFILILLGSALSLHKVPQSSFVLTSPSPVAQLATPQPILSTVAKTAQFQGLETRLSDILEIIKTVDLSESPLTTPILETNLTFEK